jgi:hypothetical protein
MLATYLDDKLNQLPAKRRTKIAKRVTELVALTDFRLAEKPMHEVKYPNRSGERLKSSTQVD